MKVEDRRRLVQLASGQRCGVAGVSGVTRAQELSVTPETRVAHTVAAKVPRLDWRTEDWIAYFNERASIREFDGRLSRVDAERMATEDTISHWLALHPSGPVTPHAGCVQCGRLSRPGNALLPVLAADRGHIWRHDFCIKPWVQRRRLEARIALEGLGVFRSSDATSEAVFDLH
jgi:hypothetical protein